MKTTIKTLLALTALTATTVSFAAATSFADGQRLTAKQLNTVSSQAYDVSTVLGLNAQGNAVVADPKASLTTAIQNAVSKAAQNCHQATCSSTVYLLPNQTYTLKQSSLNIPSNVSLATIGHAPATIALNNAYLSVGENVSFTNVNMISNQSATTQKQLKGSHVSLTNVTFK